MSCNKAGPGAGGNPSGSEDKGYFSSDTYSSNSPQSLGVDLGAKSTRYRNITFPTALEAKWAEFFDLLKIRWAYNLRIDQLGRPAALLARVRRECPVSLPGRVSTRARPLGGHKRERARRSVEAQTAQSRKPI
jgi:hypothetical protein